MSFERYRDSIIEDFKDDCESINSWNGDFIESKREEIEERFEEHKECYKHKAEFDEEDLDIMSSVIYGDNSNATIECNHCNSVIIDAEALEGDE